MSDVQCNNLAGCCSLHLYNYTALILYEIMAASRKRFFHRLYIYIFGCSPSAVARHRRHSCCIGSPCPSPSVMSHHSALDSEVPVPSSPPPNFVILLDRRNDQSALQLAAFLPLWKSPECPESPQRRQFPCSIYLKVLLTFTISKHVAIRFILY